jgi:hypothetical protein
MSFEDPGRLRPSFATKAARQAPKDAMPTTDDNHDVRAEALEMIAALSPDPALTGLEQQLNRLCRALALHVGLAGATVQVISGTELGGLIATSDPVAAQVSELNYTLNEGPAIAALRTHRPILLNDLADDGDTRWPVYRSEAVSRMRSVYAFPLQLGASILGVLECHDRRPRALTPAEKVLVSTFAQIALEWLCSEGATPDGTLERSMVHAMDDHIEIARAQGMVMVDLDLSLMDALARMRAYAFAQDLTLLEVAREVLDGYVLPSDDNSGPSSA